MRCFKIKVTTEESEVVQKLLFLTGYTWCGGSTEIKPTNSPYLFFDNMAQNLTYSKNECTFIQDNSIEITFDDFITEIEIELNEKFQN